MNEKRLVWDLPLRLFHWLFALSFIASWLTSEIGSEVRQLHMWLGYWMLGLLTFRVLWGFVGTRHARFASFFPTPASVFRYARDLVKGNAAETVGHNPVGSLMVFVMLALVALQTVSGLFVDEDIMFAGPYADAVRNDTADFFEGLHHDVVNWVLVLAIIHIAAALYYRFWKKQKLIEAMLTGRKDAAVVPEQEAIEGSPLVRALLVAAISAGFVYWLVAIAPASL